MNPAEPSTPETIGVIAGNGMLPFEIANEIRNTGKRVFILGIKGEADSRLDKFPYKILSLGQLGKVYATLREQGIRKILFAGGVGKRPDYSAIKLDWKTVKTLPKIFALMASGDNSLLSGVISIFEGEGFKVCGVKEVAPKLLVNSGLLVGKNPSKRTLSDIEIGLVACKKLGELDAGQAVVVENGRIIALEGAEGTDALMKRVVELRTSGRVSPSKHGGVLVKTKKPRQDERMDLPAIGPQTVTNAYTAGLAGLALEANYTIILDRQKTLQTAKDLGLFILGVSADD